MSEIRVNAVNEYSSGAGVTIEGILAQDGMLTVTKIRHTGNRVVTGSAYTLDLTDCLIKLNPSADMIVSLPAAASCATQVFNFKLIAAGFTVTLEGNASELIDDALNYVMTDQWDSITLMSDGTGWLIL